MVVTDGWPAGYLPAATQGKCVKIGDTSQIYFTLAGTAHIPLVRNDATYYTPLTQGAQQYFGANGPEILAQGIIGRCWYGTHHATAPEQTGRSGNPVGKIKTSVANVCSYGIKTSMTIWHRFIKHHGNSGTEKYRTAVA